MAGLASAPRAALAGPDCKLEITPAGPLNVSVASPSPTVNFTVTPVDNGGGCTSASFVVNETADTTFGTSHSPSSPTGSTVGTPVNVAVTIPNAPNGGGSVTLQAQCTVGCGSAANPTITVNIANHFVVARVAPSASVAAISRSNTSPLLEPITVRLEKNGSPGGLLSAERPICFDLLANPNLTAAISGGSANCGSSGREVLANATSGEATVNLSVPTQNPKESPLIKVRASATGVAGAPFVDTEFEVTDDVQLSIVSGDGQVGATGLAFPNPLKVHLDSNGVNDTKRDVFWQIDSGDATFVGGGTTKTTLANASGDHSVSVLAGSTGGLVNIRAYPAFEGSVCCGFDINQEFELTVNAGPAVLPHGSLPANIFVGTPVTLQVRVRNGGADVADGTSVNWSFSTAMPGTLNGGASAITTTSSGVASVSFQANAAQTFFVNATYSGETYQFQLSAEHFYQISHVTPASDSTTPGVAKTLTVQLQRNGTAFGNSMSNFIGIDWSLVSGPDSGAIPSALGSNTNGSGQSSVTFNTNIEGNYVIRATAAEVPNVKAASGALPVSVDFNVAVSLDRGLELVSGNNAAGSSGQQATLTVRALDNNAAVGGRTINWSILSSSTGTATLASTSTTSSSANPVGQSSNVVTFGSTPGSVFIRAARADDSSVFIDFALESFSYAIAPIEPASGSASGEIGTKFG
ncbi:MAG TPA: hypothetical protein VEA16_00285, partial [Vicinamibacterales bacterium]|nr:hypothetical protein [Vicinamibacterales bacterium]